MRESFVHLHVHSTYSRLEGVNTPRELCRAAKQMGFEQLALTDTNGLYGAVFFARAAAEEGLKPILGSEVQSGAAPGNVQRALLLLKNRRGLANLCRLLSERHCDPDFELTRALKQYREGLVVISDDFPLLTALGRQAKEDLFVELSPGYEMAKALSFARHRQLPPVATSRARFVSATDYSLYRVLRAIAGRSKLSRLKTDQLCPAQSYLSPAQKILDLLPHAPDAVARSVEIAKLCPNDWRWDEIIFPRFRGLTDQQALKKLLGLTHEGALWRYGKLSPEVKQRINFEMQIIENKGYSHYFLVLDEIAKQSTLSCGRGSAAASIVAYCLAITHVDPLKHRLFFERFLHPERRDPPDIDLDFAWDERDKILDWVFATYGGKRAAMVANHNGFKWRGSLREVARVYGMADEEISKIVTYLSRCGLKDVAAQAAAGEKLPKPWDEIIQVASRLRRQLRCLSVHCGGVVIAPDEIRRYVPVEIAAKGVPLIQWEKDQTEEAGLVKIDLLGNRSLAVIRDALKSIEQSTGRQIDYPTFNPLEDEKTRQLIRRGDTLGCFYVESPATRLLLQKMWGENRYPGYFAKDVFEHLVMASSIIRPAANRFTREFVKRMQGAPYEHLHPCLQDVLGETYGIAIYQEQITRMAMQLAGFSAGEGDTLRKIMSKKDREKSLRDLCCRFFEGAKRRGVPQGVIEEIWQQILSFSGYSFCKPHSASYALVSFKSAYLRAHYPAQFMAAVISNQGGFYTPFAYLNEARRMGQKIFPPSVNKSEVHYSAGRDWIRVGLMQIKGLTDGAKKELLSERAKGGLFNDFEDLLKRLRIDFNDIRCLIKAGACDELATSGGRPALLWRLHTARSGSRELDLFAETRRAPPAVGDYSLRQSLKQEIQSLGFLASCHPLSLYRQELKRVRPVMAVAMRQFAGRRVTMAGWFVTGRLVPTVHGEEMEFLSFEDTSGIFETTLFPAVLRRFRHLLDYQRPYLLRGRVENDCGGLTLNVEHLSHLQLPRKQDARDNPERSLSLS